MGGMALPIGGLGGIGAIIFLVLQLLGGGGGFDVGPSLDNFPQAPAQGSNNLDNAPDPDKDLKDFVGFVTDDVQDAWTQIFADAGRDYRRAKIVLFDAPTQTGCGVGSPETGPFYCPRDEKVYLDLGFFRELRDRFGAPGDFAQAYVIAHEYGHHVQNVLGIEPDVRRQQQRNPDATNELSVRMELQADCFAGIWGHTAFTEQILEPGDIEEGLRGAEAVGDDRIQKTTTGRVDPESWTHGSSQQRAEWFQRGFDMGSVNECDTFS
jgi:uncharacterized protein